MPSLVNWNDEIKFNVSADRFKTPAHISDVQVIVKEAHEQDQKVTVIGAMHSTTECMVGSGVIISMRNMAQVLSVDDERLTVTVQAGVTLHELCGYLKDLGLQPPVILEWGNFQIGAISGTHANDSSLSRAAQFSSYVLGVKLVTPTGESMEISEAQNVEYLPAIRSHFGMLGVICEVTLQIFRTQPLEINFQVFPLDEFLGDFKAKLDALRGNYDQAFGMLFSNAGKILLQCRKFVKPGTPSAHPVTNDAESHAIDLFADLVLPIARAGSALHLPAPHADLLDNALIKLPLKILQHSTYIIDPNDRAILYAADAPDFEFYDWLFPEANWPSMIRAFLALYARFQHDHNFVLTLPVLVYFIRQDTASLLSRSRGANMMAVDPEYADPTDPTWLKFRLAFSEVAVQHGGVPHINKTRDGAISHFAKAAEQDSLGEFLRIRRLLDPKDLFLNDYFKTLFAGYLDSAPVAGN